MRGNYEWRQRRRGSQFAVGAGAVAGLCVRRVADYVRVRPLGFATIKASTRRQPWRGLVNYRNNEAIHVAIASRVSERENFTDSRKTGFIQYHLLSMNPAGIPYGVLAGFVSRRKFAPALCVDDVPPRKKALSVYMGGR